MLAWKQLFTREIEIFDGSDVYRFRCETPRELNRCLKIYAKEPGTCEWINSEVKPGEVFYDIGANIGIYTILAARRLKGRGNVYAFEPHVANLRRLIDNVIFNDLQSIVVPCGCPLHFKEGFSKFVYASTLAGTSESQLAAVNGLPNASQRALGELKYSTTIDRLWQSGAVRPPQHVKIDVDGNELLVLQGMKHLLASPDKPRTVQVETNAPDEDEIKALMQTHGYFLKKRHYSRSAMRRISTCGSHQGQGCNAIFAST
jgi:FkbM family methyltransferase